MLFQHLQFMLSSTQILQITLEFLIGIEHLAQNIQLQIAGKKDIFIDKIAHLVDGAEGNRTRERRQKTRGQLPQTVHQAFLPLFLPRLKHTAAVRIPAMKCLLRIECAVRIAKVKIRERMLIDEKEFLLHPVIMKDIDHVSDNEGVFLDVIIKLKCNIGGEFVRTQILYALCLDFASQVVQQSSPCLLRRCSVEARLCLTSDKEILQCIQQCGLTCTAVS